MVQGCGPKCAKFILFLFNVLVWIASIVLIAIGGYVLNNSSKYSNLFGEDTDTLTVVCGFVIGVGCFIFLVGFLGCCGACMENSCFLKLYFTFLLILVLVEFVGGILAFVYRNDIEHIIEENLYKQVKQLYGKEDQQVITDMIDGIQKDDKCCGVYNFTDYYESAFAKLPSSAGKAVPVSCCREGTNKNTCNNASGGKIANEGKIYTDGCMNKLVKIFEDNFVYVGVAALVLIIVEVLAMSMACCIICGINKGDYHQYA